MATPTRHLCRTLLQAGRQQLPAKRKWGPQCLRAPQRIPPPFRTYSTTPIRQADRPKSEELPEEASASELERTEEGKGPYWVELPERDDDGEKRFLRLGSAKKDTVGGEDGFWLNEADALKFESFYPQAPDPKDYLSPAQPIVAEEVSPEELEQMKELLGGKPGDPIGLYNHLMALAESLDGEKGLDPAIMDDMERDINAEEDVDFPIDTLSKRDVGWFADDEDADEFAMNEDADDDIDDSHITSVAHSQLEVHREVREYTRVVAWDMPLLTNFVKEFKPPTESQPLRFRYTTYMGESHPAAKKVVVQFCTKDLAGLTEEQRLKLIKLVGPRYDPDNDIVKMSSEKFEAPAQNKRYLGDLVNKLIDEAKNGEDNFKDIPLDLRHHKSKKHIKFPDEWRIKPGRIQELLLARQEQKLLVDATPVNPLDGKGLVHSYVESLTAKKTPAKGRML
ncbi:hypothetical protein LTR84_009357 [Exophiala bonariae]|uniref:Small ribosomal subunit protein mS35 mitochondrial conserved domain-containing protein n=1 Tax=Exophiala bonariae TaxID=1690606 RepID=A0AAV9MUP9_9EURO|nr:hypothetical protein LTR84_009357 [Exophiala bonariae]